VNARCKVVEQRLGEATSSILLRSAYAQHPPAFQVSARVPRPGPVGIDGDEALASAVASIPELPLLLFCVTPGARESSGSRAGRLRWRFVAERERCNFAKPAILDIDAMASRPERFGARAGGRIASMTITTSEKLLRPRFTR